MFTDDRIVLEREHHTGKISKGWRVRRYSFGKVTMQHLRSGNSKTGVIDDFGNIVDCDSYLVSTYAVQHETIVPFYSVSAPPHYNKSH